MSQPQYRLPLLIEFGATVFDVYVVLDNQSQVVKEFDTEEEAEAFAANTNGWDIETVRRESAARARFLTEYRENLIRRSRDRRKP